MTGLLSVGNMVAGLSSGITTTFTKRSSKTQGVSSGKDFKLQRIINKFKAGRKLASGELSYLAQKAPEIYQKVLRIMQRREQLEEKLEQAETKEEVQLIMMNEMQSVEKFCAGSDDDFERTALVNQLMDAYGETVKSDAYQEMPDNAMELEERKMSPAEKEVQAKEEAAEEEQSEESLFPLEMLTAEGALAEEMKTNGRGSAEETSEGMFTDNIQATEGLPKAKAPAGAHPEKSGQGADVNPVSTGHAEPKGSFPSENFSSGSFPLGIHSPGTSSPESSPTPAPVTYTAQGKKKSAFGTAAPKGRRVNVAL